MGKQHKNELSKSVDKDLTHQMVSNRKTPNKNTEKILCEELVTQKALIRAMAVYRCFNLVNRFEIEKTPK